MLVSCVVLRFLTQYSQDGYPSCYSCTYTAVWYCSITELALSLDEDKDTTNSVNALKLPGQTGTRKVKPIRISVKQEVTGWYWHQLDHMQIICTSLQTDNHASTAHHHSIFSQAGRSSWCPTNSAKAPNITAKTWHKPKSVTPKSFCCSTVSSTFRDNTRNLRQRVRLVTKASAQITASAYAANNDNNNVSVIIITIITASPSSLSLVRKAQLARTARCLLWSEKLILGYITAGNQR